MNKASPKLITASHIDGEMEYLLKTPITYSNEGVQTEALFLTCYEHRGEHAKTMRKVAFVVDSAMISLGKSEMVQNRPTPVRKKFEDASEEEMMDDAQSAAELLGIAFEMTGDMEKSELFMDCFEKAVTTQTRNPLIKIQGIYPFRDVHWEQMRYAEQKDLAVKYCSFFAIGLIGDMIKKS
jgi:hypothetical protein